MPTVEELGKKVKAKYPGAYGDLSDTQVGQKTKAKYPDAYKDFTDAQPAPPKPSVTGTLLGPAKEGLAGLKTLYGGGEQGIANKLKQDVQAGAADIQKGGIGNILKGVVKAGARTAGDVAGTVFAPVGAAVGATGIGKVFDWIGEKSQTESKYNPINKITNNPKVQKFAVEHPNAGEDFNRALNLALAFSEGGKIEPKTAIPRTVEQVKTVADKVTPNVIKQDVATLRANKIKSGLEEQNTRLKTAEKSFNKNTITRTAEDGSKVKITPIDTFGKYNIAPEVEKGTIKMGDYQQGTGGLGKIKENVARIDGEIDSVLKDTGKTHPVDELRAKTIEAVKANPEFKQAGTVQSTIKKVDAVFDDYILSYGKEIPTTEVNEIRKVMNADYHPDTIDVSRIIGDTAREIVYNATEDMQVKTLLREQGELLSAKKYAETINGTKVTGGRWGNYALRTAGAIAGTTVNSLPVLGPVLGMVGGEYAARALQQTQFKSIGAETKALFQRSNKTTPKMNANNTPKMSNAISESVAPTPKEGQGIPNKQGGFIKNPFAKDPLGKATPISVASDGEILSQLKALTSKDFMTKEGKINLESFQAAEELIHKSNDPQAKFTEEDMRLAREILALVGKAPQVRSKIPIIEKK
jgi:hypothetical protein